MHRSLLLILILTAFHVNGQYKAESEEDAIFLSESGDSKQGTDPQEGLLQLVAANKWFSQNSLSREAIMSQWRTASMYAVMGMCDTAKTFYDKAFSNCLILNEVELAIDIESSYVKRCLIVSGGDFKSSLRKALQIKERSKKVDDNRIKIKAARLLIDLYWDTEGNDEEILELAIECDILSDEIADTNQIKFSKFDLAFAYSRIGKLQLSIDTYRQAAAIQLALNDPFVSASYNNMANTFYELGEVDSALHYYKLGEKYSRIQHRPDGIAASKLYMGGIYNDLGEFEKGRDLCTEALEIFRNNSIIRRQDMCTECLQKAYLGLGQKDKAYEYLVLNIALRDSLLSKTEAQEFKVMQTEFAHNLESMKDSLDFAYRHDLKEAELKEQKNRSYFLYAGLAVTGLFAFFILNRFRITRRQKKIIEEQKHEVEEAHEQLTEKNQEILDSINYAKRIQSAILPNMKKFKAALPNSFVFYQPKDIVAGDFYWMEQREDTLLIAAADCTGHGVPGAMVSVVCNNGLNRSVREQGLVDPGKILDSTRAIVIEEFEKSEEDVKDGMDIALITLKGNELSYAGANNPLWILRAGAKEIEEIKASKQPIGKYENKQPYPTHSTTLSAGDQVYIFTDGYADQFGGEKGKKFKAANFKALIIEHGNKSMEDQLTAYKENFDSWKGQLEQLDDICVIGFKYN